MTRGNTDRRQEGRYPALVAVLNRRREVFGLCDRELAERTKSRFGASKNVSQIHRILHGDSGTRQSYAEQLANVVDVSRHVVRVLIEFEDELLPIEFSDHKPNRSEAEQVIAIYHADEDMFALQRALALYERSMGHTDSVSLWVRADMSLIIGKIVRLHGGYPGFIDDAMRFVDDAMNLYLQLLGQSKPSAALEESLASAEIERATIYRRRGHLDMALRVLRDCTRRYAPLLERAHRLRGKCWHGFGDLYEQKSVIGSDDAGLARESYERALQAYRLADDPMTLVDEQAIATDLAMIEVRAGQFDQAHLRLDKLEAQGDLPATTEARLHNRRAWAYLKQGDIMRCQRFVKKAAHAASKAGDSLLMSMAEVLRLAFYDHLEMKNKADIQYDAVLDWVYRDGVRHAEVLKPVIARANKGDTDLRSQRLGWLLRAPWLNALVLALCISSMGGCVASDWVVDEAETERLISLSTQAVQQSDPKLPVNGNATAQSTLTHSDPKRVESDPKRVLSDPKKVDSDPKKIHSDPKTVKSDPKKIHSDPKKVNSDPKKADSDPKKVESDPKRAESDPKRAESDPKKAESDPKKADSDPKKADSDPKKADSDPKKVSSDPKTLESDPKKVGSDPKDCKAKKSEDKPKADKTDKTEDEKDMETCA